MSGSMSPITRSVSILTRARSVPCCPRSTKGAAPNAATALRRESFMAPIIVPRSPGCQFDAAPAERYSRTVMRGSLRLWCAVAWLALCACAADKQILLIAGKPSHPPGQHEHNAGVLLLAKWLNTVPGVHAIPSLNAAWPSDDAFDKADAIFIFADGGEGHPAFQDNRPATLNKAAKRGT